jgi:competence protein ComFC
VGFFRFIHTEVILPFIDTLFPPICAICNGLLPADRKIVCASCIDKLIPAPDYIQLPLHNRSFDDIFILCEYDERIRSLIHLLKYNRFTSVTYYLAERAQQENRIKKKYNYIIPVPLHKIKLRERGYNQSEELAKKLAVLLNIPFSNEILIRKRYTVSQTRFSREGRLKNVKNAFTCTIPLEKKSLLLVDDVVTTGSTVEACSCVLKSAGAQRVDVFALANPSLQESQILI